ncbi:MAG: peptidase and DD-carboxypeptidase VanY/endolysin [Actinomycetia bacterium]|nr:peptidase and DD-carboxypeptidase VanY/endolysin [Actinomycetes bacterium]
MTADARRRYWIENMDKATAFMRAATEVPVAESGERLVDLAAVGGDRFEVAPSATGELGVALLRESLVGPFEAFAAALNRRGLVPVVQYAYRSPRMQQELLTSQKVVDDVIERVRWECEPGAVTPELAYDRLVVLCANSFMTGTHLAGTALDVMVRQMDTGDELDFGGPYLTMSEITPMASPFVSATVRTNREAIVEAFSDQGFYPYPFEYWHYSRDDVYGVLLGHDKGPARHGPVYVDLASGMPTPVVDPARELMPRDDLLDVLAERLRQLEPR